MSEYVKKYASEDVMRRSEQSGANAVNSSAESSMSKFSDEEAMDMEL